MSEDERPWMRRWRRFSHGLKYISMGQYETPLYHHGLRSQSSVIGGILTLGYTFAILTYALVTVINVIDMKHHNIDQRALPVKYLERLENETLTGGEVCKDNCIDIKMRDFLPLLQSHRYMVTFPSLEMHNCSKLTAAFRFLEVGQSNYTVVTTVTARNYSLTPECYFHFALANFSSWVDQAEESAFYQFFNTRQVFARLNVQIDGMLPENELYRIFDNDTYITELGMSKTLETSPAVTGQS